MMMILDAPEIYGELVAQANNGEALLSLYKTFQGKYICIIKADPIYESITVDTEKEVREYFGETELAKRIYAQAFK